MSDRGDPGLLPLHRTNQPTASVIGRYSECQSASIDRYSECQSAQIGRYSECQSAQIGRYSECQSAQIGRYSECQSAQIGRYSECQSAQIGRYSECKRDHTLRPELASPLCNWQYSGAPTVSRTSIGQFRCGRIRLSFVSPMNQGERSLGLAHLFSPSLKPIAGIWNH
ncbi:hypothetical protein RRG08_048091 [Elysia crispata]|uniref:Uncharacterized protein n=1 Tax=Elysia crispata TaxID=231223 RepID=A0AAE1EA18_9GAST|nr:hypothetical protein RRG08_048091 [Elysia crispata]